MSSQRRTCDAGRTAQRRLQEIAVRVEHENRARSMPRQGGLARRLEQAIVRHRDQTHRLQVAMLGFFLLLVLVPLLFPLPAASAFFYDNARRFALFVIWGVWFPLVFVTVIFAGRSWCGALCPLGAFTEWANRRGLKRPVPAWIRWRGTPVASFLIATLLTHTLHAHQYVAGTLEVFGLSFVGAAALGWAYGSGPNKRVWCRHACPIGSMLGLFSRLGIADLVPKRPRAGGDVHTQHGICPTLIDINRKKESRHCIACARCVHPNARGGLALVFRRAGSEIENIRNRTPDVAEVVFLCLAAGVAIGGLWEQAWPGYAQMRATAATWAARHGWSVLDHAGPAWLMAVHPATNIVITWLDSLLTLGGLVAATCLVGGTMAGLTGLSVKCADRWTRDMKSGQRLIELFYVYIPIAILPLALALAQRLFDALTGLGVPALAILVFKVCVLAAALLWSLKLGFRLLGLQGASGKARWIAWTPLAAGIGLLALFWYPLVFCSY